MSCIDMSPQTNITYTHTNYIQWPLKICDLYRYEAKDTHYIHTNKLNTMTFIDMRPKTHTTYTQTN